LGFLAALRDAEQEKPVACNHPTGTELLNMMTFAAIAFVVVLWGASTAGIFFLDSLPTRTFRWSMAAATLVLALCAVTIWQLRDESSTFAIAASFAAALLAWGWTEMSLYMGYITGPRKARCADGCSGVEHFGHAVSANLWHELVVIAFAAAIWASGNVTAFWCFAMLWLMHLSARLNVFLGVRNVSAEFVPDHMDVLKGFLRRRNMNPLFPLSCLLLVALITYLVTLPQTFSSTMAVTLAVIGLLEHLLLMLPLPIEKMWHWSLSPAARPKPPQDDHTSHQHSAIGALP
jgi:putative photosynthetic complex assembly protein 2